MTAWKSKATCIRTASFALLAAFWSVAPLWPSEMAEGPGDPKAGRDLFVRGGCIRCHSVWRSDTKKGPSLASVGMGRNLYELCASVWTHWSRMNAMRERENEKLVTLSAAQIRDIIAYLYYLNYSAQPGDARLGEETFNQKACIQCHAVEPLRSRNMPGRAVYEMSEFVGAVPLAVAVWNHGGRMFQTMSTQRIRWPEFQEKEVVDLVEFIRSRNGAPRESLMEVPGDPARGRVLFRSKSCSTCHAPAPGAGKGPNLASLGAAASVSSLIASLWNHYPKMSGTMAANGGISARVTREEMQDILAYVYWLKACGLEGNAAAGRSLYQSKQCASCHSSAAPGSSVATGAIAAPSLMGSTATSSVYALLAAIWNHGPRMESLLRVRNIPWPTMTGEEMRDLVAYFQKGENKLTKK